MAYKGQPFQKKGFKGYKSSLRGPVSLAKARGICQTRGARYSTEEAAKEALVVLELTKVNPGALKVFSCINCDGFHLGTAFGPSPRTGKMKKKLEKLARRRPRI